MTPSRESAKSKLMLIKGVISWVSVCSLPSLSNKVNVRIFKVHTLISKACIDRKNLTLLSPQNDKGNKMAWSRIKPRTSQTQSMYPTTRPQHFKQLNYIRYNYRYKLTFLLFLNSYLMEENCLRAKDPPTMNAWKWN